MKIIFTILIFAIITFFCCDGGEHIRNLFAYCKRRIKFKKKMKIIYYPKEEKNVCNEKKT